MSRIALNLNGNSGDINLTGDNITLKAGPACSGAVLPAPTTVALQMAPPEYSSVDETDDVQLPALTSLPMHRTKSSSDLYEDARTFSALSAPCTITEYCIANVPSWNGLLPQDLVVDQILSGLSNQLFKVDLRGDLERRNEHSYLTVLFRIYGKDVETLYDSSVEVRVFKKLGELAIAPTLIAEFNGGRIETWIEGSALLVTDMGKISVMMGASAILSGIHEVDLSSYIDTEPCIDKFLHKWRTNAMKIYGSVDVNHPSYLAMQRLRLPDLYEESFKLNDYLFPKGLDNNVLTRLTFCHNDVQENNIMVVRVKPMFL